MRTLAASIAFNEERKIGSVLDRFEPGLVDEVAVVDDGSSDNTAAVVRDKGATLLTHEIRRGAGAAIRTAIGYARENGFGILVILAGNDKDRPAEIPRLTGPIRNEAYDFVQGSRYLAGGRYGKMPVHRRLATGFVHPWLFSIAVRRRITDSTNGFRAIRLSLFDDPRIDIGQDWLDHYELEPYLFYKAVRLGYRVTEVPVTKIYPPKSLGYTKMKPFTGWWSIVKPVVYLALGLRK
ncbi:glycosyltransferase family 2 protein [Verrucomicrobiota bacterium]